MKYAAKRTWPEKSQAWEHQGDSVSIDAFASEFAVVEQLPVDTEFVVMEKEGDSPTLRFFRVQSAAPCRLTSVEPRGNGSVSEPAGTVDHVTGEAETVALPSIRPFISMIFYMGKVGLIATAGIAVLALLRKSLFP